MKLFLLREQVAKKYRLAASCMLVVLLLSACSSPPQRGGSEVEDVELSTGGVEQLILPDQRDTGQLNPAIDALLARADSAIKAGRYEQAAVYAERAIRMAPMDARAYFGLAQIHFYQNRPEQGRSFLARAETLAEGNRELLAAIRKFSSQVP